MVCNSFCVYAMILSSHDLHIYSIKCCAILGRMVIVGQIVALPTVAHSSGCLPMTNVLQVVDVPTHITVYICLHMLKALVPLIRGLFCICIEDL
jgi:hypothetical protein